MTFFYRRLPPLSRRKNGVLVVVDESAAKYCKDGDIAHNRYSCQLFNREAKVFSNSSNFDAMKILSKVQLD